MYESHYGLSEKPFSMLSDPQFLFRSERHQQVLSLVEYGLLDDAMLMVISGEIGTGKTTLVNEVLQHHDPHRIFGLISNTPKNYSDLLHRILLAFEVESSSKDVADQEELFFTYLREQHRKQRTAVLIIDESQHLDAEALEDLRMLSNINTHSEILLQIILVGQPELLERLKLPELRQFAQRISFSYELLPLTLEEAADYIQHRLQTAGAETPVFSDDAMAAVYHYSAGIPRLINALCDTALLFGFADGKLDVDIDLVKDVVSDKAKTILFAYRFMEEELPLIELREKVQWLQENARKSVGHSSLAAQLFEKIAS